MKNPLRLLGLSMTLILSSCSSFCKPPAPVDPPKPAVITVDPSDIKKNDDGSFTVSKKWMLYRMSVEQRLKEKLIECRGNHGG